MKAVIPLGRIFYFADDRLVAGRLATLAGREVSFASNLEGCFAQEKGSYKAVLINGFEDGALDKVELVKRNYDGLIAVISPPDQVSQFEAAGATAYIHIREAFASRGETRK